MTGGRISHSTHGEPIAGGSTTTRHCERSCQRSPRTAATGRSYRTTRRPPRCSVLGCAQRTVPSRRSLNLTTLRAATPLRRTGAHVSYVTSRRWLEQGPWYVLHTGWSAFPYAATRVSGAPLLFTEPLERSIKWRVIRAHSQVPVGGVYHGPAGVAAFLRLHR